MAFGGGRRRLAVLLMGAVFLFTISSLFFLPDTNARFRLGKIAGSIGGIHLGSSDNPDLDTPHTPVDAHPISNMMAEADQRWRHYEGSRSSTFRETVSKYRRKYSIHPPPGFQEWYKFARSKHAFNVDDFDQIMDDLRPFWAIEPRILRTLAAHMWEDDEIAGIHIRNKKVVKQNKDSWRSQTMVKVIEKFVKFLPDMDIAMNRLDQPRVVVPWHDMQAMLMKAHSSRRMFPEVTGEFTKNMSSLLNLNVEKDESPRENAEWFGAPGKQYMEIVKTACPPETFANGNITGKEAAEAQYKNKLGGIITNFNMSSDLCTIGPTIQDQHGFLFSSASLRATKRLVPIFGECKVNVNSDILFPANKYYEGDDRYDYNKKHDLAWKDKADVMIWRGVSSGGVQTPENWRKMHRHRFILLTNGTKQEGETARILTEQPEARGVYENFRRFKPSIFAKNHTDVGFVEVWGCFPKDCGFLYDNGISLKPTLTLSEQFKSKFVVDIDGHSFSGRWRAFLQSKSLGIKATIFREWHDSRLFAWRHFVPMDNRFDDIYTILTYFIGVGQPENIGHSDEPYVANHDAEAKKIALQGREWANKVLRREDIEV